MQDRKTQNKLVNSIVPADATYALAIASKDTDTNTIKNAVTKKDTSEEGTTNYKCSETEAIGIAGTIENFERGLAKGQIWREVSF